MDVNQVLARAVADDTVRVPPYPATAMRLQKVLAKADYTLNELVEVMRVDPVFTGNLLRLANSSFYRRGDAVTSLQVAVQRLGAKELTRLAMASAVGTAVKPGGLLDAHRRHAWRQALTSALLAEALAKSEGADAGEAFVAGLLHDTGKLLAVAHLEAALSDADQEPEGVAAAIEAHHVRLGELLAKRWELPPSLAHVIAQHHGDMTSENALMRRVQWADVLVEVMEESPRVSVESIRGVLSMPDATARALEELIPKIPSAVEAFNAPPEEEKPKAPKPAPPPHLVAPLKEESPRTLEKPVFADVKGGGAPLLKVPVRSGKPSSVVLECPSALAPNALVEVSLSGGASAKFWAVVQSSTKGVAGFAVELKPFALGEAAKTVEWLAA